MGIINATPDSFSDGGDNENLSVVLEKVGLWLGFGVDILDIGGESTRPGSEPVPTEIEIKRTIPLIQAIKERFPHLYISIDTTKYEVAEQAIANGADMINDISGLTFEPRLAELASKHNKALCIMHLPAPPKIMQQSIHYDNLLDDIYTFLSRQIAFARSQGVEQIYADVGIGFGKTFEQNWELLRNIDYFRRLGVPLLLGISRKRFIGEFLQIPEPKERDFATMLIHALLWQKQIEIIRVHNVEMAVMMRKVAEKLNEYP
ncbi:MAG TPA: dihydropteroate synthase [Candidatus Kapabacteria bacterium]|nr:dihydropteroate synthase [Candidatus Kapabacteria bacterium]HPU23520.1 dihydropteroate synthase [Candidatus Kapabacteria bacterium]